MPPQCVSTRATGAGQGRCAVSSRPLHSGAVLRFKVGPFPVTIYPWFFLSAILLGAGYGFGWRMAAWIFVVFVSVLVHELGHALVGRAFGGRPEIRLEAFGGVTFPQFRSRPRPGRQFILSFAGPIAGLLLGAVAYGTVRTIPPEQGSVSAFIMGQFIWVSVVWAAFNLLPILPLDGGNMLLAFIEGVRGKPSLTVASWISVFVALASAPTSRPRWKTPAPRSSGATSTLLSPPPSASKPEAVLSGKRPPSGCAPASSWRAGTTSPLRCSPARATRSGRAPMRRWWLPAPICAPAPRTGRATGCAARSKPALHRRPCEPIRSWDRSPDLHRQTPTFRSAGKIARLSARPDNRRVARSRAAEGNTS
ncbi:MAG: hypothetical protein E6J86_18545 [Deltaproteobacteria bacterium]|nr:MAG: hypothetical protein E6J86_18545 [Deltaproteobacteria bacterium]